MIRGGLGAILTQVQDGITRPIGYFNRQFRESECKYNAYNAELTGIVASLNHFYYYLKGSRTTIITDHLPIVKNGRRDDNTMHSLRIRMNQMDIELIHKRGDSMPADALQATDGRKSPQSERSTASQRGDPTSKSNIFRRFWTRLPTHNVGSAMEIRTIKGHPLQGDETIRRK